MPSGKRQRALTAATEPLYREIRTVLETARTSAYRAVNTAMVQAYWTVGRLIVEHEQGGAGARVTGRPCWKICPVA